MAALLKVPVARADQISDVPSCALVRPIRLQLRPPPDTVAVWPPPDGPDPATKATTRSPAVGVDSKAVAEVVPVAMTCASLFGPAAPSSKDCWAGGAAE